MDDNGDWFGPDAATFGDRVSGAREAAGMSRSQLARRMGIKKATLAGWEEDLSEPRANKLSMLAGLLNVSIMWLLTGEGEGMSEPAAGANTPDLHGVLAEVVAIKSEMQASAERLGRLELKLRRVLTEPEE